MDQLRDFINAAMEACGGVPAGVNQAVLSVWIGPEGKYSFVEFTTVECATVALGLNGINCMGFPLKISRPSEYYSDAAMTAGGAAGAVDANNVASQVQAQLQAAAAAAAAPTMIPPAGF